MGSINCTINILQGRASNFYLNEVSVMLRHSKFCHCNNLNQKISTEFHAKLEMADLIGFDNRAHATGQPKIWLTMLRKQNMAPRTSQ